MKLYAHHWIITLQKVYSWLLLWLFVFVLMIVLSAIATLFFSAALEQWLAQELITPLEKLFSTEQIAWWFHHNLSVLMISVFFMILLPAVMLGQQKGVYQLEHDAVMADLQTILTSSFSAALCGMFKGIPKHKRLQEMTKTLHHNFNKLSDLNIALVGTATDTYLEVIQDLSDEDVQRLHSQIDTGIYQMTHNETRVAALIEKLTELTKLADGLRLLKSRNQDERQRAHRLYSEVQKLMESIEQPLDNITSIRPTK